MPLSITALMPCMVFRSCERAETTTKSFGLLPRKTQQRQQTLNEMHGVEF